MKNKINKWIKSTLNSNSRLAIPIMTHPGIELINKKIIEAVTDGNIQYKEIKTIQEKYSPDAATMIMDLTVEAEAFGSNINFTENDIPTVTGRLLCDMESIEKLKIPTLSTARLPQFIKAAKLAVDNITDKPVFAGCIGPFTLAGRLFDLTEIMTSLSIEPEAIKLLLKKCSTFLLSYIFELKKLGVNGIVMAEPASGLLSPEMCDEFSSEFIKQLVNQVQDENFLLILHNCGNTGHVTQSMFSPMLADYISEIKLILLKLLKKYLRRFL